MKYVSAFGLLAVWQAWDVAIELSVTVWERTYRASLTAEFFNAARTAMLDPFDEVRVVVNNVDDEADALDRVEVLQQAGVVSQVTLVREALPTALQATGLRLRHLQPLERYSGHFLVKFTESCCDFVCHWDTDAKQDAPADWVREGARLLAGQPKIFAVNPAWPHRASISELTLYSDEFFDYGFGFSDQAFLVRRRDMILPIYRSVSPGTWWQPTSHLAPIFEQRVDAHMRRHRLWRAIYRDAIQRHDGPMQQHAAGGVAQRVRRRGQHEALRALGLMGTYRPRWHFAPGDRAVPDELCAGPSG